MTSDYKKIELKATSRRVQAGIGWEIFSAFGLGTFYVLIAHGMNFFPFTERPPFVGPLLGAVVYKLVALAWTGTVVLSIGAGRELLRSFRTKGALIILVGGAVGGGLGTSCIFIGSAYAGAAVTSCIVALSPLFSIAGAYALFREKVTSRMLLAACMVIVGAIAVYSTQLPSMMSLDFITILGILGATLGALGWGLEAPIAIYALDVLDTTVSSFVRYLIDSICGLSIILFLGAADLVLPSFASNGLPFIFVAGLTASSALMGYFRGLPMIGVGRGTAILNIFPLFTILLLIFFGQTVSGSLIVGGVFMVIGLFVLASEPKEWLEVLRSKTR